jgi:hypothetical protein
MTFAGYPRDAETPEAFGIVDLLMLVLENTYRGFPTALGGPTKQVIRAVLTNSQKIRTAVLAVLEKRLLPLPEIQAALQPARVLVKSLPPPPPVTPFLPSQMPGATPMGFPSCFSGHSVLTGKNPPRIRQPAIPLRSIHAASVRTAVTAAVSERVEVAPVPTDQIRRRLGVKGTIEKAGYRTALLLASHLAHTRQSALPIASVDPTQSASLLRDIGAGFLKEASQGLKSVPTTDVTVFCLLADYTKSKAEARKVRATERITYVQRMANFTDLEREVNMDLAKRGMAPVILALEERRELGRGVDLSHLIDIGVGLPQDTEEQGDIAQATAGAGVDNGNYGDYEAAPVNDGRDPQDASLLDDRARSI